ncbi:hypothetical protein JTE90_012631 [Oedothorax gibbosus]|uniref:Uncharacterized protein n=1 Tax=Oedothorax gibbosus TaxID=931172 RepID=A0AAV6UJW7_9ARAC|nr:hypothetical protein JTE90_012631 [Oedothorax gibbosus]
MDQTQSFVDTSRLLKWIEVYNDKLPENCIHFGNGLIAVVCFENFKVNIHLCEFVRTLGGALVPSENKIVLSPFLFESLCSSFEDPNFIDLPTSFESFSLLENDYSLQL